LIELIGPVKYPSLSLREFNGLKVQPATGHWRIKGSGFINSLSPASLEFAESAENYFFFP